MASRGEAVVLLSGGLDSTTIVAMAKAEGYAVNALTFDYGQRHKQEVHAAAAVAKALGASRHVVVRVDAQVLQGSALTDAAIAVPKDRDLHAADDIPVTYVPARNTIFLSYALAWAEVLEAWDIFIGVNALDYSGYPDCRPEYVAAYERMANLATKAAVEGHGRITLHAPLIQMTKAQIVARGIELGVDFSITLTCYEPSAEGAACGHCDACQLRLAGFAANGVADPALYAAPSR